MVSTLLNGEYDDKKLNIEDLEKFVKKAGFKSLGIYDGKEEEKKNKNEKIMFFIYGILAVILLYISMGHMMGLPIFEVIDMNKNPINYTIILFILTILFLIYGFDIIKSGFKNLIHKTPNMDTLVGIGVISSFLYSIYSMIQIINGNHHYIHELYLFLIFLVSFFHLV